MAHLVYSSRESGAFLRSTRLLCAFLVSHYPFKGSLRVDADIDREGGRVVLRVTHSVGSKRIPRLAVTPLARVQYLAIEVGSL